MQLYVGYDGVHYRGTVMEVIGAALCTLLVGAVIMQCASLPSKGFDRKET